MPRNNQAESDLMRTPTAAQHRGTGIQPVAWLRAPQGDVCLSSNRPNPRTFTSVDSTMSAKNPIDALINMLEVSAASG